MSIPALIVPTLNQDPENMLLSIDHPVEKVVVIDNGNRRFSDYVEDTFNVVHMPHNLGVGASWNLGIKLTPLADWWLIANDDLTFGESDLDRLVGMMEPRSATLYFMLGMAAFAVTPPAIEAVGFWDENIHPAYDEDLDWSRRADLAGIRKIEAGFTGTHIGSAAIHSDPVLRMQNGTTHGRNDRYYAMKWGGPKEGGEQFTTPFGKGGDVGDWRLSINRLREQTWRR